MSVDTKCSHAGHNFFPVYAECHYAECRYAECRSTWACTMNNISCENNTMVQ
jgi:hypothetical protein